METLVVFYSRSGSTKKIGEEIAKTLNADIDEIIDRKDRSGIKGLFTGPIDILLDKHTKIESKKNPLEYDLVIIGTPVWLGTMTPAIKTYLADNDFNRVAFFCTYGSTPGRTFNEMEKSTRKPEAVLGIVKKEIEKDETKEKIKNFSDRVTKESI